MSKICTIRGCRRKVPSFIKNNPKGEPLCAVHHGLQVRMEEDRITCTIIDCTSMAYSGGLCKNHSHSPREPRMDLTKWHTETRQDKLKLTLGNVLRNKRPLHLLQMNDFNCLYCNGDAHSSLGASPPHCCPVCWAKIEKIN